MGNHDNQVKNVGVIVRIEFHDGFYEEIPITEYPSICDVEDAYVFHVLSDICDSADGACRFDHGEVCSSSYEEVLAGILFNRCMMYGKAALQRAIKIKMTPHEDSQTLLRGMSGVKSAK